MAVPELDLAYGAPDLPLADPLSENAWRLLLGQWLGHLQGELPGQLQSSAYSMGLQLCADQEIAALNGSWRHKPEPTDVLAFPTGAQLPLPGVPLELGDIVISLETASRQALSHGHGLSHELCFLASHGLLHLLGWDHPDEEQLAAMLLRQEQLIELFPAQIGGNVAE